MITLEKPMTADNGAVVNFHGIRVCEIKSDADVILVHLASWPSSEAYTQGHDPVAYSVQSIEIASLPQCAGLMADLVAVISDQGPFQGAVQTSSTDTLEFTKAKKLGLMKVERQKRIKDAGETSVGVFNTDAESRGNIATVALDLALHPSKESVRFTCADNVRREFTRQEFLTAATEIAEAIQLVHERFAEVRIEIEEAADAEELQSVTW